MSRITIGTAQFGSGYGVANVLGEVSDQEAYSILKFAESNGINSIDTAISYGGSESRLGKYNLEEWQVGSKLPPLPDGSACNLRKWVFEQVEGSLSRLNISMLDSLLLHRPVDLFSNGALEYLSALEDVKSKGLVKSVGVSIYDPSELDSLWTVWRPDLVQAPVNVLDRRLINSGWLDKLVSNGIRVHARSVFLQGILVMSSQNRPSWFERWRLLLDQWHTWCEEIGYSPLEVASSFVMNRSGIEKVVIGVESVSQLQKLVSINFEVIPAPPDIISSSDKDLIEPSRWRIQ